MKARKVQLALLVFIVSACNNNQGEVDAFGNFEAREILVSAETSGRILKSNIEEGCNYEKGFAALEIDATQSELKKKELEAKKLAVEARKTNIEAQVNVHQKQLQVLQIEKERVQNMMVDGAATSKQLDDINGQKQIVEKQILAVKSNLGAINAEIKVIDAGIAQVEDIIERSAVKTPKSGVILNIYIETGEVTAPGRTLFKMANLDVLELKAYVSGNQLSSITIGQDVNVFIDGKDGEPIHYRGILSWISENAEFTPKNIQTREERLSQVYAIKIKVKNDGALKVNMPAEVRF